MLRVALEPRIARAKRRRKMIHVASVFSVHLNDHRTYMMIELLKL